MNVLLPRRYEPTFATPKNVLPMATKRFVNRPSDSHEPKAVGVILQGVLCSDSHLANGYRRFREALAEEEAEASSEALFKGFYPNTELGVDLKLITRERGRMRVGAYLNGIITRDDEDHYCFTQTQPQSAGKRNPHLFDGQYITVTRRDDGSLRLNFKELRRGAGFSVERFSFGVYRELYGALKGLIEEKPVNY